MNNITISKNYISRLSKYKNSLARLKSLGFVRVFSDNIADAVGVTSAQVRKDFSLFGISGTKKGGYTVDDLLESLNNLLGKDKIQKAVIVGSGSIGSALLKYSGFESEGIKFVAAFDSNQQKINTEANPPVLPIEDLEEFIKKNDIKLGVIAVPDQAAQLIADTMVKSGIKGILNFAPIRLRIPEEIVINNVNLVAELESVIYFVNAISKAKNKRR